MKHIVSFFRGPASRAYPHTYLKDSSSRHEFSGNVPVVGQVNQALQPLGQIQFLGMLKFCVVQNHRIQFITRFKASHLSEEGSAALCSKVKRFLNAIMQETLEPIRNRRKEFSKDIPAVYEMLQKGCEVARAAAAETLADVKKAMKINYFDDKELIEEQVKRFAASQE